MRNYPLGFAIIEWKSGGYSEAIISNDREGNRMFHCANWINTGLTKMSEYQNQMENVITDFDDIVMFLSEDEDW